MGTKSKFLPRLDKNVDPKEYSNYLLQMIYELQTNFYDISDQVDGSIKSSFYQQTELWIPTLNGITTTGTFTYGNQIGWVYRQGLMVDIWCNITWTAAGTATGNLYLELPYKVTNTSGTPFIGEVQYSGITLGLGNTNLFIDAIGSTYRGEIWQTGTGLANTNLAVQPTGELSFHLRYLGVRNE